jgi:hypothetical protein
MSFSGAASLQCAALCGEHGLPPQQFSVRKPIKPFMLSMLAQ